ncbi:MAG TPA: hypothetical protein V6D37_15080 [Candidatus Sericytochromatia bacterium]
MQQVLNLDVLGYGCDRAGDYWRVNAEVEKSDRLLRSRMGTE